MNDSEPSSTVPPYLFRVHENVSAPLRRYTINRTIIIPGASIGWIVIGIPVFVMDVFGLNLDIFLCVALFMVPLLLIRFGASAALLDKPIRALAEMITCAAGKRVLVQDVVHALKKAPWGAPGNGAASRRKLTLKDGIRFSSKGSDWLVRLSPDISTGTVSRVDSYSIPTEPEDAAGRSSCDVNSVVIPIPQDILKRRLTAAIHLCVSVGAIVLCGLILSLSQSYIPYNVVLLITAFVAMGAAKILKNLLMSDSNREISEFICASLQQSTAFKEALFVSLRDGTFSRITSSGFAGAVETLEVLIEPQNEPAWVISEIHNAKSYRLQRSDGRSFEQHTSS